LGADDFGIRLPKIIFAFVFSDQEVLDELDFFARFFSPESRPSVLKDRHSLLFVDFSLQIIQIFKLLFSARIKRI